MSEVRKNLIRQLLKGIETGDPESVSVVDESRYVQHNPQTKEGSEGLAQLFARLAKTKPHVNIVRAFSDGDFVFAHTEYDFATRRIGFEVFLFDADRAVEHWDNIQERKGPGPSGRSMVDGPTASTQPERTEDNRTLATRFTQEVLINRCHDTLSTYLDDGALLQHSPSVGDGGPALLELLKAQSDSGPLIQYKQLHRVLADGSFVLCVSEGQKDGAHTAFYDLYRMQDGFIAEHWDTVESVAPVAEWKNNNGKF